MKKLIRRWLGIDYDMRALSAMQDELCVDLDDICGRITRLEVKLRERDER